MVRGRLTPEKACKSVGGKFNTEKSKCEVSITDSQDTCKLLGGDYDFDDETCDLPISDPSQPGNIFKKPIFMIYFSLQVVTGAGSTILASWYTAIELPDIWWTSYVMLAIVFAFTIFIYYYRLMSWKEAISRATMALIVITISSMATGWIYNWDITIYWNFVEFAGLPIASTILGISIAALLSIVIIEMEKRRGDDSSNDFGGGASLAILG